MSMFERLSAAFESEEVKKKLKKKGHDIFLYPVKKPEFILRDFIPWKTTKRIYYRKKRNMG